MIIHGFICIKLILVCLLIMFYSGLLQMFYLAIKSDSKYVGNVWYMYEWKGCRVGCLTLPYTFNAATT